ncbi:MAG: DUF2769 domain-containing protein [bacterium]|nr:DUF2769 domain-containing protein [bacterium]
MSKISNTKENFAKCTCGSCPTYQASSCAKKKPEKLYCATGKSSCDLARKGCICGACPIWSEYNLSNGYFCFSGEVN